MGFDAWDKDLKEYLSAPSTQPETAAWLKGVDTTTWDLPLAAKQTAYLRNLFHYTVGDPGFWCQLGFFLALGVAFRRVGFGDGAHNTWYQDAATFTVGYVIQFSLSASGSKYSARAEHDSAVAYAMANFPMRMLIVPFTSTFVPLLLGHGTGSLENIAACWVQHFLVLAISWQVLAPKVSGHFGEFEIRAGEVQGVDFRAAPYAQYAWRVEELKNRLAAVGPYVWCAEGVVILAQRLRAPPAKGLTPLRVGPKREETREEVVRQVRYI